MALMDCYDDDSTELEDCIRAKVFERDGHVCWLCNNKEEVQLEVAHQIDSAAIDRFSEYKANGTIPPTVTNPDHPDNSIPLCANCHLSYDAKSPGWVLIPDAETLQKFIDHEKIDYEIRKSESLSATVHRPRSLPSIDRSTILYHPLIITKNYTTFTAHQPRWPKRWMGEPTTVIHRAARCGLFESTPTRSFNLPGRGPGRAWQTGVPGIFQVLVGQLIRLWARK